MNGLSPYFRHNNLLPIFHLLHFCYQVISLSNIQQPISIIKSKLLIL
jgi:hypothetical protein